jgi:hypothetical protein
MNPPDAGPIVLRGLEGNPPANELGCLQRALAPHDDTLVALWTVVWFVVLAVAIARGIVIPLLRRRAASPEQPPADAPPRRRKRRK